MSLFVGTSVLFLLSLAPLGVATLLAYRQFRRKSVQTESYLVRPLVRSPGGLVRREISRLQLDLTMYLGLLCCFGPYSALLIMIQAYQSQRPLGALDFSIFMLCTVGLSAVALFKFSKIRRQIETLRRNLDCELAVGHELDQLREQGCYVFHDVPCDGFNIDHVVVGRNGVFSIETRGRSKPSDSESKEYRITIDSRAANIPVGRGVIKDTQVVEQTLQQGSWLNRTLSEELDEKIVVKPILVYPGWTITNYNEDGFCVFNEKQIRQELLKLKVQRLADANVERIARSLSQRLGEPQIEPQIEPQSEVALDQAEDFQKAA